MAQENNVPTNQTAAFVSAIEMDLQSVKMAENWALPFTCRDYM